MNFQQTEQLKGLQKNLESITITTEFNTTVTFLQQVVTYLDNLGKEVEKHYKISFSRADIRDLQLVSEDYSREVSFLKNLRAEFFVLARVIDNQKAVLQRDLKQIAKLIKSLKS